LPITEAIQEAEVSKRRRDWAFSERDKIVLERESIRTLCDRLRKERDRAVSDLAEALRDSDDIKKQRNEASKELKELKYVTMSTFFDGPLTHVAALSEKRWMRSWRRRLASSSSMQLVTITAGTLLLTLTCRSGRLRALTLTW
jgi:hypothetical protein